MRTDLTSKGRRLAYHFLRSVFRITPLGEVQRQALRNWFSDRLPHWIPTQPLPEQPLSHASRRLRACAAERAIGALPHRVRPLPPSLPATLVAFYLPQFHPTPENDEWWGEGFTEWRNVTRALPQFEGHFQPRLPGSLGFYDLRDETTLKSQAALAREYGISAFCFYYYWFNGRRLLESPLERWLDDPSIDFPVCLCWANEPWSRRWDGRAHDILIPQHHDPVDDEAFIAHVARYMRDPRYLRVDDRPLILIYRPGLLPDARATVLRWREWARNNGLGEIFVAYVQAFDLCDPSEVGCDAAVEFPPNLVPARSIADDQVAINPEFNGQVLDWRTLAQACREKPPADYLRFPGVNPGWDNQPRRPGSGRVLLHASPKRYEDWLTSTIQERLPALPPSRRLVFVNAWNEWAEGATLEPDLRWDHAWLDATREAQRRSTGMVASPDPGPVCAVIHAWYPHLLPDVLGQLDRAHRWRLLVTTGASQQGEVDAILRTTGHPYEVIICENRGRDILPFLCVAARLRDEGHALCLKLHTKLSPHRADGSEWRRHLVEGLLPSEGIAEIVRSFSAQGELGILAPEGHLQLVHEHLGGNASVLEYCRRRVGVERELLAKANFVGGSMFWVRIDALSPLLDAGFMPGEFETESGQLDGTLAHAVERMFVACAQSAGYFASTINARVAGKAPAFYKQAHRRS